MSRNWVLGIDKHFQFNSNKLSYFVCLFLIVQLSRDLSILQERVLSVGMSDWLLLFLWFHWYISVIFNAVSLLCDSAQFVLQSPIFSCLFFLAYIPQITKVHRSM